MVTYSDGDLFEAPADALVNPVNCVGTMGKGLALQFKKRFPGAFRAYSRACSNDEVKPGSIFTFTEAGKMIFHFPTKRHWRDDSNLYDIVEGLEALRREIFFHRPKTVAVPALGCGLGGLKWSEVRPHIVMNLEDTPASVIIFPPQ